MLRKISKKAVATAAALMLSAPLALAKDTDRTSPFSFSTGGGLRYPNTVQDKDGDNFFASGWLKAQAEFYKSDKAEFGAVIIGSLATDSKGFNWNNNARLGFGAYYKIRPAKGLSVTFNLRQEYYGEYSSSKRRNGLYASINYYYFKSFKPTSDFNILGMQYTGAELKSYGAIKYPGSLKDGDSNVTLKLGLEYGLKLAVPNSKLLVVPYASINLAADLDGNNYNNKVRPAVGFRVKYPLEKGSLFVGINAEADYRPINGTTDFGVQIAAGWYKKF